MEYANYDEGHDERMADLIYEAIFDESGHPINPVNAEGRELIALSPVVEQLRKMVRQHAGAPIDTAVESFRERLSIGKYQVVGLIGRGGQSAALLAIDPDLERRVVIKLYYGGHDEKWVATLLNEGRLLARIHSRYVARCRVGVRRKCG